MGNLETKPSDCAEQPWWSIENEIFSLNQPNINEIIASINEPDEIRYPTVREKILAKLRDRKYSSCSDSEDQSTGDNNNNNNSNNENYVLFKKNKCTSRSSSESEPTDLSTSPPQTDNNNILVLDTTLSVPQTLEEFREELRMKRIARQTAINDLRSELYTLKKQLKEERELNRKLKNGDINILIEKKDIAINTENDDDDDDDDGNDDDNKNVDCSTDNINCDNKNDKNKENENNKFPMKTFCDICVQTDPILISNNENLNINNETNDSTDSNDRRIIRSSSDTQQINLKAQLAELQLSLQLANADNLSLTTELAVVKKQVASLKEVIACSRQMIDVREEQVQQLRAKLCQIEESLADRELKIMSENLRQEYDRQLANIRNLRQLYEERARVSAAERENLLRQIAIKKDELAVEILKVKTMEERISTLENELTASKDKLNQTKEERDNLYIENKSLKEEMAVINKLFSQMLTGFNGTDNLDIDRLTTMLEENRTLLNEIAIKETNSEGASLPKLLFDIVNQANKNENDSSIEKEENESEKAEMKLSNENEFNQDNIRLTSAQEIVGNLPKVWRILIEFLNHQKVEKVQFQENGQSEECYKSVQTSTGTKSEISVSKTYLKLKDLILEKKSLMKETNRLKTLNSHLEHRLDKQEKRLSVVSLELTKTWHLVGKMQRQHRQLHTHEQILRYQLQQKKRLLSELKEELEYCRRKWAAARAKNAESQLQCDDLRKEFASRKLLDANNSAESGYSDGPGSSDEESSPKEKKGFVEFLEPPRKIERTHSISPVHFVFEEAIVRSSSAPPITTFLTELLDTADEITTHQPAQSIASTSTEPDQAIAKTTLPPPASIVAHGGSSGAIPKQGVKSVKLSRGRKLESYRKNEKDAETLEEMYRRLSGIQDEKDNMQSTFAEDDLKRNDRVERINRLEEQCKSLIAQVIETSDNREKLQVEFCQFQAEIEPAQHPVPFEEYLSRRRTSAKDTTKDSCKNNSKTDEEYLTPRETEYTNRRSERLKRLEEESNQLMSRIKRTTDKGKNMKTLLDKLHSRCSGSREGSFDSCHSTDDTDCEADNLKTNNDESRDSANAERENSESCRETPVRLTAQEEAYTARRSERLKRLEEESKLLMTKLSRHSQKGTRMNSRIDALHLRYGSEDSDSGSMSSSDLKESKLHKENSNMILASKQEISDVQCEEGAALPIDIEEKCEENEKDLIAEKSDDDPFTSENISKELTEESESQNNDNSSEKTPEHDEHNKNDPELD